MTEKSYKQVGQITWQKLCLLGIACVALTCTSCATTTVAPRGEGRFYQIDKHQGDIWQTAEMPAAPGKGTVIRPTDDSNEDMAMA